MPLVINVGDAFLLDIPDSNNEHLYIAIAEISSDKFLFVNISTYHEKADNSCILTPKSSTLNFVKQKSYVYYKHARDMNVSDLRRVVKDGTPIPYETCSGSELTRIQQAGLRSKRLKRKYKEALETYLNSI